MTPAAWVSLSVFLAVVLTDLWVYADARKRRTVPVSIGALRIESPQAWVLGCLLLWIVFFPLYLTATGRNPFARGGR